jgi:hypothetical protein
MTMMTTTTIVEVERRTLCYSNICGRPLAAAFLRKQRIARTIECAANPAQIAFIRAHIDGVAQPVCAVTGRSSLLCQC